MKLYELVEILQGFCHEGYACDEVEILDSDGNTFEVPDAITLSHDKNKEIVQIAAHHKKV